jgi:hypothetical protein
MEISYNKSALTLIIMGIALFVINAVDVFLGYFITHGKRFQVLALILIAIRIIIWKIQSK